MSCILQQNCRGDLQMVSIMTKDAAKNLGVKERSVEKGGSHNDKASGVTSILLDTLNTAQHKEMA